MDPKQARNEKSAIIFVGLILGAIAYTFGHAWDGALSKLLPIPAFFCMGPLAKTIFFATIQRDFIPQGSKRLILSSFAMSLAGLFTSMLGPLFSKSLPWHHSMFFGDHDYIVRVHATSEGGSKY
jgi:hypothetical protein